MKLYDWPNSYNSRKIRAIAFECDLPIETVVMNMAAGDHKKADFLEKNPNGKVPLLEDGNFCLWESNAICCYIAGKDPARKLLPTEPQQRANVDKWMFWQSIHLAPSLGKIAFERIWKQRFNLGEPDESAVVAAMPDVERFMTVLDTSLATKQYLAGDLSVADFIVAATFISRQDLRLDITPYPHVVRWLDQIENRPSWKNTATW